MPRGTVKLAVSGGLEAEFFLECDDVANCFVLGLFERVGVDLLCSEPSSGLYQFWWTQKTADEVGAEGGS